MKSSCFKMGLAAASGLGIGCYWTTKCFRNETYCSNCSNYSAIPHLPAMPLFASVSAASPIHMSSKLSSEDAIPAVSSNRISKIMKYGFPSLDQVRSFDDFVLAYDRRNRVAHWVFEHLTLENTKPNKEVDRGKCEFSEDNSVHSHFRATNVDYRGSGFDRGHLAAAGNHKAAQRHCEQTFLLSNIAPQVGVGFNRDSWNRLEKHVRKLTRSYPNVYVCTGPLYLPQKDRDGKLYVRFQVIGPNNVAVPTHFFKVVAAETADSRLHLEAYIMPNQSIDDNTPLKVFQVPPDAVERAAGLLFFDQASKDKITLVNGRKQLQ